MGRIKAFTLIELLVVISIIALLLAIMMPALGMVKEKARSVVCRTNLKQLQLAATLYASENGGRLFQYGLQKNGQPASIWAVSIASFIGDSDDARYCGSTKKDANAGSSVQGTARTRWGVSVPDDALAAAGSDGDVRLAVVEDDDSADSGATHVEYGSYGFNGWLYSPGADGSVGGDSAKSYRGRLNSIRQSSNVPMFADAIWYEAWPLRSETIDRTSFNFEDGDSSTSMGRHMIDRHNMRSNIAFVDGHAEAVDLARFWGLKWNQSFRTSTDDWGGERQD